MSDDQRFFDFLKQRIGLDVASVGLAIIERAVRQRCLALNMHDNDHYWQRLISSPDEQQALIESVIVPETWFFRYPESFATLGRLARQRLAETGLHRTLRILSLPCSTGEEPYSIAMALFDAGLAGHQFRVEALDVSPLSVERAQSALYGKNSFRGQEIDFRERYFTPLNDGYQLAERVCEQVNFNVGNLLDPMLLSHHVPYDFVFCRNLLIYFDLNTQHQALDVLKRLTREDGVLFIGPAEGSLLNRLGMRSISAPQSFAFCHSQEPLPVARPLPAASTPPPKPLPRPVPPTTVRPFAPRAPAPVPVPPPAQPGTGAASALLAHIAALANEGKSTDARQACEQFLQQHGPHAQAFYWLGLLSDVEGQAAQAQSFYRKALYLEPQHSEALAHLAALLASQGDVAGAQRLQERAARHERSSHSERKQ
ncbi:protein-glutamate O-methyltransferase CheR [Pseudomonas sp. 7P_10.2_Bac1]|uniref:CheR family methyltransferase n=1 Tax=Pseudomonas sp. 7P_10.2_Bac1 TaxID=2971614 RepID=UPI0021C8F2BB|nr:protein-glutamate O-methyltransferase CheR [Pseudomonas sp. 7P_10.2_Bac1]MCU1728308.1 protein-glutamate O-methyltransferase CheR [Pseudomonas sp. 7P_10.2_Bac1]